MFPRSAENAHALSRGLAIYVIARQAAKNVVAGSPLGDCFRDGFQGLAAVKATYFNTASPFKITAIPEPGVGALQQLFGVALLH